MRQGWDVEFVDLGGMAQFDFLACKKGIEIEVECKTTSWDTGQKIHRKKVNRLADLMLLKTQQLVDTAGCHLIRVTIQDRLGSMDKEVCEIATLIDSIGPDRSSACGDLAEVKYRHENISVWPEPNHDPGAALAFFDERLNTYNAHILFHSCPGHSIVAVTIGSVKSDNFIHAVADQAKKAADQCSGTRPALIILQFIDQMSPAAFSALGETQSGLLEEITYQFNSLYGSAAGRRWPDRTKHLSAHVVPLFNDKPKFECDQLRAALLQTTPYQPYD